MTTAAPEIHRPPWPAVLAVTTGLFVGLTVLRAWDITATFLLQDDQIRYWDTALRPFSEQPLVGPRTHYGGYALGPLFYWVLWFFRVTFGPFVDNLPHAGAFGQILLASAADVLLLLAVWRRARSLPLALGTVLLLATAPFDLALNATIWNPIMAAIAIKAATALILLGWGERSLVHVGVVAALAWSSVHANLPAIFAVGGIFVGIVLPPLVVRDMRAAGRRVAAIAGVVVALQLPYLAHRLWVDPSQGGVGAVTTSLGQVLTGEEPLRWGESASWLTESLDRILIDPWQASWIGWLVAACALFVTVRYRKDIPLLAVTVVPLLGALLGYTLWTRDLDHYYYLSLMPAAGLILQSTVSGLTRGRTATVAGVAVLVLAVAILPARVRQSTTFHRMPGYDGLVAGSRQILRQEVDVRQIRADFLPPHSNSEFIYLVLGGRLDREGRWIASIDAEGLVSYQQVSVP